MLLQGRLGTAPRAQGAPRPSSPFHSTHTAALHRGAAAQWGRDARTMSFWETLLYMEYREDVPSTSESALNTSLKASEPRGFPSFSLSDSLRLVAETRRETGQRSGEGMARRAREARAPQLSSGLAGTGHKGPSTLGNLCSTHVLL